MRNLSVKKNVAGIILTMLLYASVSRTLCLSGEKDGGSNSTVTLQIDGSWRYQQIDGFGVNANTASWNGKELEPALNLLIDSLNATIWRVIVESEKGWEESNDDDDPFKFNWIYYNALYETRKFQKAWDMIAYLNGRGIDEGIMLNIMGRVPEWMGKEVIKPEFEDEFVEMIVSFLYYGRNVRHLKFGLMSPMNEPDIKNEGPTVGALQYARILGKMIERMEQVGLGDIGIVAPDVAGMKRAVEEYIPLLMADPGIMSRLAYFGLHSYGGYSADVNGAIKKSAYSKYNYWMTEWNAWRDGLDYGQIGLYDYTFAGECAGYLLQLLKNGASAGLVWEAYDSVYEHPPGTWSYWGILGYGQNTGIYTPRKHFYTIAQFSKYILPGAWRISVSEPGNGINILAFYDDEAGRISIVGDNANGHDITIQGKLKDLPKIDYFEMYYTSSTENLKSDDNIKVAGESFAGIVPAHCIFTITGKSSAIESIPETGMKPQPSDWYAGDIHVHRSCGGDPLPDSTLHGLMEENDLAVISVLADMGNAEVKDATVDLPKVNGKDAPESMPGRIIHWDAEWHWDATYSNFEHQALGGHLVILGLREAHQIWDESPYKILEWAKKQNAIAGFAHMQYLDDTIQSELNCCIPIDYPVETALGTIDFLSEDVRGDDAAIHAYYKLLNCGFRPGFTAGTDYPCNNNEPLGTLLTYVRVPDKPLTYGNWIEGVAKGRTVVSRNGHNEFLELVVDGEFCPGDEIRLKGKKAIQIEIKWSAADELTGTVELVCNGKVVADKTGRATAGAPFVFQATQEFTRSGWVSARRMGEKGHMVHTAAVYVSVDDAPVRASDEDAQFFVKWIDNVLTKIEPGGVWNRYFTHDLNVVLSRYRKARDIYSKIAEEAREIGTDRSALCPAETLRYHALNLDDQSKIIPWYTPAENAFDNYLEKCWAWALAAPADSHGLPISFLYCAWKPGNQPSADTGWENDVGEKIPNWVESARLYYQYTGDMAPLDYVKRLVDYSLDHGQTPPDHAWPDFPVGTSNAGDAEFRGFTQKWDLWDCHVDLAADMGFSYYRMYQIYGDTKYREKAIHIADMLAGKMTAGDADDSPWPYVINSQTGADKSRYAASWDGALQLFDSLIENNEGNVSEYVSARSSLKTWLLTYPMQNGNWVDGHSDVKINDNTNWSTTCASDMCLYLLDHPGWDPNFTADVPKLLKWIEDNFVNIHTPDSLSGEYYGAYVPAEQTAYMYRMGYQAARMGGMYAQWYAVSDNAEYKDRAYRCLSYNTYMMQSNGQSSDGPTDNVGYWWSDCYGEATRMYYYGLAAVPEWGPPGENHILYSYGTLKNVAYAVNNVQYTATDNDGIEYFRLNFIPENITVNAVTLLQHSDLSMEGYTIRSLGEGDYAVNIRRERAGSVMIAGR